MSDQLQLWYLNYIPHASNNPSKVNVDRGGQIADLAKAIAIELQLPEAESSFIEIWKPKEELVIEEDEGERRSAGKILLDRLGDHIGDLRTVATKIPPDECVETVVCNGKTEGDDGLVHVIVQINVSSRKRHIMDEKPGYLKRKRVESDGSDHYSRSGSFTSMEDPQMLTTFSSNEHKKLDGEFKRKRWDGQLDPDEERDLFMIILMRSADAYKNTEYPMIEDTLRRKAWKKYPHLREIFIECKERWSFQELREQAVLHWDQRPVDPKLKAERTGQRAWQEEYSGDSHELLLNVIRKMNSERLSIPGTNIYANYLPIVQSSGTGKSRMVDEMVKLIFTIPFCIRDPYDESDIQFPQADKEVAEFLLRNHDAYHEDVLLLYLIFFEHLFVRVGEVIEQQFPIDRYTDESDLARAWWEYLLTERTSLYTSVIERIDHIDIPKATDKAIERQTQDTVAKGSSLLKQLEKFTRRQTEDENGDKDQTPLTLVLYFDETNELMASSVRNKYSSLGFSSRYGALESAFNHMRKLSLFAVTISTRCSLYPVPALTVMSPSARLHKLEYDTLQAQYTELPFDCLLDGRPLIAAGQCSLEDTCELSFMCRFGRPLWMTLYKHGNDEVRETMVDLAMDKLTGIRGFNDSAPSLEVLTDARLAILATRLLLDFNTRETGIETETQMLRSKMRIAYSIPAHRYYLRSGYPSEPILAEAAARAMAEFRQPTATILASFAESGLIDIGNRGELVMRLLLLQAFDAAAKRECSADKSPSFNRPVHLFDFLEALLGSENLEKIKKKVPGDTASSTKTFEEAFKNAQVHFTHFARNEDISVSNSYGAWAALARGMAMQCSRNQDGIDCIVPVLLNSNDKLCEEAVTGLLIQCKKEQSDAPVTIKEEATGDGKGGFFPQDKKDERPYIGLIMQLGREPGGGTDACENPPRDSAREIMQNAHHPCYLINIKGCSPVEYPVIEQEAVNSYAVLLGHQDAFSARRDLFSEHARQGAASLKAVQRLKPTWTTKREGCYDWLKDPMFGQIIDEDRGCGAAKGSQQEPEGTSGRRISNGEGQK